MTTNLIDPVLLDYCPCGKVLEQGKRHVHTHFVCLSCYRDSALYWRTMLTGPDSTDMQRVRAKNQILNHARRRGMK